MENVVREVNSELFEFVAKNVYETYKEVIQKYDSSIEVVPAYE